MNFVNEFEKGVYNMTVEIQRRITETSDAFIIENIIPYCENELGRRIEKTELINALTKNTPLPVLRIEKHKTVASCPRCLRTLEQDQYPEACGFCGQRIEWEEEKDGDKESDPDS